MSLLVPFVCAYDVDVAQALDFYLTDLLAKYQRWLVESPSKMDFRMENAGNLVKELIARQVRSPPPRSG